MNSKQNEMQTSTSQRRPPTYWLFGFGSFRAKILTRHKLPQHYSLELPPSHDNVRLAQKDPKHVYSTHSNTSRKLPWPRSNQQDVYGHVCKVSVLSCSSAHQAKLRQEAPWLMGTVKKAESDWEWLRWLRMPVPEIVETC